MEDEDGGRSHHPPEGKSSSQVICRLSLSLSLSRIDRSLVDRAMVFCRFEAVTLPECVDMDVEQSMLLSDASIAASRFQRMVVLLILPPF